MAVYGTHKILYGSKRSCGPYNILWATDQSINSHLARSAVNYLLYYISPPKTSLIFSRNKDSGEIGNKFDVIMVNLDEDVIWTGPGLYTVIWTGWLTKTNRENINIKYNIY